MSRYTCRMLLLQIFVLLAHVTGTSAKKPPPPVIPENEKHALGFNWHMREKGYENEAKDLQHIMTAEKRYFEALGQLTPSDVVAKQTDVLSGSATALEGSLGKCPLSEGCVSKQRLDSFLDGKWIPGYEASNLPIFVSPGQFYNARAPLLNRHSGVDAHRHFNFRNYIMTRPSNAVPLSVRMLLGGGGQWPGDQPRSTFTPRSRHPERNAAYVEKDITPLAQDFDAQYHQIIGPNGPIEGLYTPHAANPGEKPIFDDDEAWRPAPSTFRKEIGFIMMIAGILTVTVIPVYCLHESMKKASPFSGGEPVQGYAPPLGYLNPWVSQPAYPVYARP